MQPTPAGASPQADFGSITIVLAAQDDHYRKLVRLRAIKAQLRELRAEHDQLEQELFGQLKPLELTAEQKAAGEFAAGLLRASRKAAP